MTVRAGRTDDLGAVARILEHSPEAAQWLPAAGDFLVAECECGIAGVLVWRATGTHEKEILNLAIEPALRRRGFARALLSAISAADVFLEVRESNRGARSFYQKAGFQEVGRRRNYYRDPPEAAIVMRLQS